MLLQSITSSFTKIGSCQVAICNSAYAVTATASANGVGGRPPHCRLRARPRFVAVFAGRGPTTYPWYGISGWQSLCGCLPPQPAFSGTRRTRRHCPVADVFSTAAAVIYTFNQPLLAGAHGAYAVPAPATAHGVHAIPAAAAVPPPPPAASASPPPSPKPSFRRGTPRKRRPCRLGDDVYAVPVSAVAPPPPPATSASSPPSTTPSHRFHRAASHGVNAIPAAAAAHGALASLRPPPPPAASASPPSLTTPSTPPSPAFATVATTPYSRLAAEFLDVFSSLHRRPTNLRPPPPP